MSELEITIKPAASDELDLIHSKFTPHSLIKIHHERYAVQEKNEGVYLIAWHNDTPVGHLLLRWNGPPKDPTNLYPFPTPYLEGVETKSEFRRRGVATRLITEAENRIKERGATRVGITVGSTDNPAARNLYEKLGYVDWGKKEFEISWEYKNVNGNSGTEYEQCIYLFKEL